MRLCCAAVSSFVAFATFNVQAAGDDLDESKLPPPATNQISFSRDIRPMLETSCLRCHGPEKPRSRFRLDDRAAALKGGDNGIDIVPGNSAASPLAYYAARVIDGMEMPPEGRGDPLTARQVALLRAWIDQGAAWDVSAPGNDFDFSFSAIYGQTAVSGDRHKYRELNWQKERLDGGFEQFDFFERTGPNTKISLSGHELRDDYKIVLALERTDLGFIHSGWEQYRKYFDDTGGYFPGLTPTAPSSGQDLHLDLGKAWIDFGLTLPDWPRLVVGYELDYKRGTEADRAWNTFGAAALRNITPASRALDEQVHLLKFDLDHEIAGVGIEERFRGEFYSFMSQRTNSDARVAPSEKVIEGNHYFQGANTLRFDKQFRDWLYASGGYLYSHLSSDATFLDTISPAFVSYMPRITLERESHVFNANTLLGPFNGLTCSAGVQGEWTRERGFGAGRLNPVVYALTPPSTLGVNPATVDSDSNDRSLSETIALRYSKIPFTALFAEARLRQERVAAFESDLQPANSYLEHPSFADRLTDLRFGFSTSPWRAAALSAHYRRMEDATAFLDTHNAQSLGGYPGFIRDRDQRTDEVEARLVLQPLSILKTSFTWQFRTSDFWNDTNPAFTVAPNINLSPAANILAGQSRSQTYAVNATLNASRRLFLSSTFSYSPSSTVTASAGTLAVVPYRGDMYSIVAAATYALNAATDCSASYSFSESRFSQNNFAAGLPLGLNYHQHAVQGGLTRRLNQNVTVGLRYGFFLYDEPSTGSVNNYAAHALFATFTCHFR